MTDLDELSRLLEQATRGPCPTGAPYAVQKTMHAIDEEEWELFCVLRNHAEELVRDARRMEWAEKHMNAIDTVSHPDNLVMIWHGPHEASAAGRTLRAAIDAAIAQEQK